MVNGQTKVESRDWKLRAAVFIRVFPSIIHWESRSYWGDSYCDNVVVNTVGPHCIHMHVFMFAFVLSSRSRRSLVVFPVVCL